MTEAEIIMLHKKLEQGEFELSDALRRKAVSGLKNVIDVLNENIPERLANPEVLPDISLVNGAVKKTRDRAVAPLLARAAKSKQALEERAGDPGTTTPAGQKNGPSKPTLH